MADAVVGALVTATVICVNAGVVPTAATLTTATALLTTALGHARAQRIVRAAAPVRVAK